MPRIPEAPVSNSPGDNISSRRLRASGNDIGAGTSVINLGNSITRFGEQIGIQARKLEEQKARNEITDSNVQFTEMESALSMELLELGKNVDPGDEDFTKNFMETVTERTNSIAERFTTPGGQRAFQERSARIQSLFANKAVAMQTELAAIHATQQFNKALDAASLIVQDDPTQFERILAEQKAAVDDPEGTLSTLQAKDKIKIKNGLESALMRSQVIGFIKLSPEIAIEKINNGDFELSPNDRAKFLTEAQDKLDAEKEEAKRVIADNKAAETESHKQTVNQLGELLTEDKLTVDDIDNSNLPLFGTNSKRSMYNLLKARTKDRVKETRPVEDHQTYFGIVEGIQLPHGTPGRINNMKRAYDAYEKGNLTWENVKEIQKVLNNRLSPEGETKAQALTSYFQANKDAITKTNRSLVAGRDTRGDQMYRRFQTETLRLMAEAEKRGIDPLDLVVDREGNNNYLGAKYLEQFQLTERESREFRSQQRLRQLDKDAEREELQNNSPDIEIPEPTDPNARRPGETTQEWFKRVPAK